MSDKPTYGRCCSCGYTGHVESVCEPRDDKTHCNHWWDGPRHERFTIWMTGQLLEIYETIAVAAADDKELSYQELANETQITVSKVHFYCHALVDMCLVEIADGRKKRNFAQKWIRLKKDNPDVRTNAGRIKGMAGESGIQSDSQES